MTFLKDLMSRNFEVISPDALLKEAMERMERLQLGVLLVCQDRCVRGVLVESELHALLEDDPPDLGVATVRDFMNPKVLVGQEDQDVRDLVGPMRLLNLHLIPVVDRESRMLGVFTLGGPWKRSAPIAHRSEGESL